MLCLLDMDMLYVCNTSKATLSLSALSCLNPPFSICFWVFCRAISWKWNHLVNVAWNMPIQYIVCSVWSFIFYLIVYFPPHVTCMYIYSGNNIRVFLHSKNLKIMSQKDTFNFSWNPLAWIFILCVFKFDSICFKAMLLHFTDLHTRNHTRLSKLIQ